MFSLIVRLQKYDILEFNKIESIYVVFRNRRLGVIPGTEILRCVPAILRR